LDSEIIEGKKGLLKKLSIYVIIGFIPMGFNFFLAPLYSFYLNPEEYALLGLTDISAGLLVIFISLGLRQAFSRYYFDYYKNESRLKRLFGTTYLTILTIGLITIILGYFLWDVIAPTVFDSKAFSFLHFGLPIIITSTALILNEMVLILLRNEEKENQYSIISLGYFLFSLSGIITGVVLLKMGAIGSVWGRAIGGGIFIVLSMILIFNRIHFNINYSIVKKLLSYGYPLIGYTLLLYLLHKVDIYFVGHFYSDDQFGVYSFVRQVTAIFPVIIFSIFNAISPKIYKSLKGSSTTEKAFIIKLNDLFFIVILLVVILGVVCVHPFFDIMINNRYMDGKHYLGLIFLMFIPQALYSLASVPLLFFKKTKSLPIIVLLSELIYLPALFVLNNSLGFKGIALALIISRIVQVIITTVISRRLTKSNATTFSIRNAYSSLFLIIAIGITNAFITFDNYLLQNGIFLLISVSAIILIYKSEVRWAVKNISILKSQFLKN